MVRLQKHLADAGVASRRAGEQLILEGRVAVNGRVVTELGTRIDPQHDQVTLDKKPVKAKKKVYLALHKPKGLVSSKKDEHNRPTIYELLPKEWSHVHSVGRLDYATEGLLFLTNDGDFSLRLTHPRFGVIKHYLVTVEGKMEPMELAPLLKGVHHDGERLRAQKARIITSTKSQTVIELQLAEGKNREVRRMFEVLRRTIKRLQRIQIGKIKLGELRPGKWRTLTEPEIKSLLSGL